MADQKLKAALLDALKDMTPEERRELLGPADPATPETSVAALEGMLSRIGQTNVAAIREARKLDRAENPNYPEKSVFNPLGKYDDEGKALPPKMRFCTVDETGKLIPRDVFYNGAHLDYEQNTPEEIALCNAFTKSTTSTGTKEARHRPWTAVVSNEDGTPRLTITVPSKSPDDRMELPNLCGILRELLNGPEAVTPDTMARRIAELEATVKALTQGTAA